jgi:hypothetical protein
MHTFWLAYRPAIRPFAALAALTLALAAPSSAANDSESEEIKAALGAIQAKDQLLHDIGWRLVVGNADFCEQKQLAAGLQLLDLTTFKDPGPIRQALGLDGDFIIQTVAAGSPADKAGLKPNTQIIALDANALADMPSQGNRDWQRLAQLHDIIDKTLVEAGKVVLTIGGGEAIAISGTPVCATRFELDDSGKRAVADGQRVQVGAMFPAISYPEDEFAAAIAHELAHNVLRHRAWLDSEGRSRKNVRMTEREADRLMPWLLANAGYDPGAALRFMRKWGPRHSGGIFRKRTHEGWDERAEHIAEELEGMRQYWDGEGPADWQRHFMREARAK